MATKYITQCKTCGKSWTARSEYELEKKVAKNPCKCGIEASKVSDEELLNRLLKSGGMSKEMYDREIAKLH